MACQAAVGIQLRLEIVRVDIRSLERDPDQRPEAIARHHDAAHKSSLGGGEPLLCRANGGGVHKGEAESVQAEAGDGEDEVEAGGDRGEHEAGAVQRTPDGH